MIKKFHHHQTTSRKDSHPEIKRKIIKKNSLIKKTNRSRPNNGKAILIALFLILTILAFFSYKSIRSHQKTLIKKLRKAGQELVLLDKDVQTINSQQLMLKIRDNRFQIIDIRSFNSYTFFHIESSINLPFNQVEEHFFKLNKKKKIVIVDHLDGQEARILSNHLNKEGLDVFYAIEGVQGFVNQGYPVVKVPDSSSIGEQLVSNPVTVKDVVKMLESNINVKFIDVRGYEDYEQTLVKSTHIPGFQLEERKNELPIGYLIILAKTPYNGFSASMTLKNMNIDEVAYLIDPIKELEKIVFEEFYKQVTGEDLDLELDLEKEPSQEESSLGEVNSNSEELEDSENTKE